MAIETIIGLIGLVLTLIGGAITIVHRLHVKINEMKEDFRLSIHRVHKRVDGMENDHRTLHHSFDKHLAVHIERERLNE